MQGQSKWLGRLLTGSVFEYAVALLVDTIRCVQHVEAVVGLRVEDLTWKNYLEADSLRGTIHRRTKIFRVLSTPCHGIIFFQKQSSFTMRAWSSHGTAKPSYPTRFERHEALIYLFNQFYSLLPISTGHGGLVPLSRAPGLRSIRSAYRPSLIDRFCNRLLLSAFLACSPRV